MIDPFADELVTLQVQTSDELLDSDFATDGSRVLLPLSLTFVVFVGCLMPWVIVRPLSNETKTFNLTDIPGGIGILMTAAVLVISGAVLLGFGKRAGLLVMSISAISLSWMATISGMTLGVVGSLIPSIKVLGIDLGKAQIGQGSGVAVTLVSGLLLGMLTIRKYEPIASFSPGLSIRVLPLLAIAPLITITVNFHSPWLVLGNGGTEWGAEVPGDSFYGSGILLLLMYTGIGMWFLSLIVRARIVAVAASISSLLIAIVCGVFAVFVWIGGKALQWLLPGTLEDWTSISIEPSLYISLLSAVALFIISIIGFFPVLADKSIGVTKDASIANRTISMSDVAGASLMSVTTVAILLKVIF